MKNSKKLSSIDKRHPDMHWWRESMQNLAERMEWWSQARFGCFIHWGVFSELGGVWQGEPVKGYSEHIMRLKEIPKARYIKDVAARFNPVSFDAEEWVRLIKQAGMRYLVFTAKHHDGLAMYDSDVSDYNVVKATPFARDPLGELKVACDKYEVKLGVYYSHSQDWGEPDGTRNFWEFGHAEKRLWWQEPGQEERIKSVSGYYDRKAIPQVLELVEKYDPDILWFDTPPFAPDVDNIRLLKALRKAKPDIIVNSRIATFDNYGDFLSTCDRPLEFPKQDCEYWEGIPTTNESYGFHCMDNSHKSAGHFIELLIKAVEKGGNILANIGPKGDGKIDDRDISILEGIGDWMNENGNAIYGAGFSPLPPQSWGETSINGNTLNLYVLNWPENGELLLAGLLSNVKKAYLENIPEIELEYRRINEKDIVVKLPEYAAAQTIPVVRVEIDGCEFFDNTILLSAKDNANILHVFDSMLTGSGLSYGVGHKHDDCVRGFNDSNSVKWPVRLNTRTTFNLAITYTSDKADDFGGCFEISVGENVVQIEVEKAEKETKPIATVTLNPGTFFLSVKTIGKDLVWLHSVRLCPLPASVSTEILQTNQPRLERLTPHTSIACNKK